MNYLTSIKSNPVAADIILFLVRVFIGFAMISHGFPKLMTLMNDQEIEFFDFLGIGQRNSLILAIFAEFICSIFLILGLFTRWALFFLMVTMVVAATVIHGADPFSDKEKSLLYLSVYLLIFVFGPGKYSVDAMISRRREDSGW